MSAAPQHGIAAGVTLEGRRRARGLAALLLSYSLTSAVAAEKPVQTALSWRAPEQSGCADPSEIRTRIARLTERTFTSYESTTTDFQIVAELAPASGSWRADIALLDRAGRTLGTREVQARIPDCRGLDVPSALVIATMLDDVYAAQLDAARDPPQARNRRLAIGASATAAFGGGPRPWLGTTLVVEWPFYGMVMPITASAYLPVEQRDSVGRGTRSVGFHGGAAVCPQLGVAMLELRLCVGAEMGGVWATGVGLTKDRSGVQPMLLVGLEPKLLLSVTPDVAIQVAGAGYWVAVRPTFDFQVRGQGTQRLEAYPFALMGRIGIISFLPW